MLGRTVPARTPPSNGGPGYCITPCSTCGRTLPCDAVRAAGHLAPRLPPTSTGPARPVLSTAAPAGRARRRPQLKARPCRPPPPPPRRDHPRAAGWSRPASTPPAATVHPLPYSAGVKVLSLMSSVTVDPSRPWIRVGPWIRIVRHGGSESAVDPSRPPAWIRVGHGSESTVDPSRPWIRVGRGSELAVDLCPGKDGQLVSES